MQPHYYHLKKFQFESGEVLNDLTIEYTTFGHKKTDENGKIINAVLYLHGWSGSYTSVGNIDSVIGPGKAVDTNRFFIISPTALGSTGSSAPSTSSLGPKFPQYSVKDMVKFHKELIDGLKIEHLKGVIGTSMGGFQALNWAICYPDFMDYLILIATSQKSSRQMNGAYGLMSRIIKESSDYNGGKYTKNPIKALEMGSTIGFLWSLTPEYFEEEFETDDEFWDSMNERNQEVSEDDANDIIWRNQAMEDFEADASKIRTKTLVIGINNDQVFPPDISTVPLSRAIEGAEIFLYNSILGHYGCVKHLHLAENAIRSFLEKIS
ncbi:MAG TPA: alpha/beta fold hydrolase [Methanobacteriaceae archaeon]|nr:alpha/beta fold hydrolase [Methanobacteriaceae archaeon]